MNKVHYLFSNFYFTKCEKIFLTAGGASAGVGKDEEKVLHPWVWVASCAPVPRTPAYYSLDSLASPGQQT